MVILVELLTLKTTIGILVVKMLQKHRFIMWMLLNNFLEKFFRDNFYANKQSDAQENY